MQYKRCKCGAAERWDTGEIVHECEGCEKCQTTFSGHPDMHKPLQPHDFSKILYNQSTGKPYKICSRCHAVDRESFEAAKLKD